eukprot:GHVN01070121.1.p2 GENE.GHVN01070121.1~~GHVN01070121.1.p2  ORF type:complete len:161 (-),score=4.74 GHVN01070121.1:1247-1729(-)
MEPPLTWTPLDLTHLTHRADAHHCRQRPHWLEGQAVRCLGKGAYLEVPSKEPPVFATPPGGICSTGKESPNPYGDYEGRYTACPEPEETGGTTPTYSWREPASKERKTPNPASTQKVGQCTAFTGTTLLEMRKCGLSKLCSTPVTGTKSRGENPSSRTPV